MIEIIKKRIIPVFIVLLFIVSCGTQKSVSYSHKPLAAEGCSVTYSVVSLEAQPTIIVSVKSDRLVFSEKPILQLKNFKGEVLKLEGTCLQSSSKTSGLLINNVVVPISELKATAQFYVGTDEIPFFKSGISKVRISTIPIIHEKTFTKDCIGEYLYKELLRVQATADNF